MGIDPISILAIGSLIGGGAALYSGQKQASATKEAMGMQQKQAQALAAEQERQTNKMRAKTPDIMGLQSLNKQAAATASATTLTGPQGVDPNLLMLGRSVLLGQ